MQARAGPGEPAGSLFFCVDLLEHFDVKITLDEQLHQPCVLGFERAQPLDVDRVQLPEMVAPGVDRGFAELVLLGCLGDRRLVGLAQDGNRLIFVESAISSWAPLAVRAF